MDIFRQKLHHIFLVPKKKFEKYFINVKQMSVECADGNFMIVHNSMKKWCDKMS